MSPTFLYLVTLRSWEMVWGTFLLSKLCRTRISKPFLNQIFKIIANFKFLKLLIFNQQQMSPTFLYLGNPEELRDGVGDIFALKIMQNPNLETVFKSEQISNF